MPLRKYSLIGFAFFLLAITIGISTSSNSAKNSRASSQDIDRQIGVILSLIDPINHGRTSQMYLANYLDEIESGDVKRAAESLELAKAMLAKADVAFVTFMQTELLEGERKMRECYRVSYLRLRQLGMAQLLAAAERHNRSDFNSALVTVAELRGIFEKHLSGELILHERHARQLNDSPTVNYFLGIDFGLPSFSPVKGINYVVMQI